MTSPLATIATRVLADHQFRSDLPGIDLGCYGCDWTTPWDQPLADCWGQHRAHQAAETARAVAEDEGLREVVLSAIRTAIATSTDFGPAVIDALTREENAYSDENYSRGEK